MDNKVKINKNLKYISENDNDKEILSNSNQKIDKYNCSVNITNTNINRNIISSDYIDDKGFTTENKTIEQFRQDIQKEQEKLKQQKELEKQEMNKIEEPLDLSECEIDIFAPKFERKVSFRRTFGITESKRRNFKKIATIILLIISAILFLVSFYLSDKI